MASCRWLAALAIAAGACGRDSEGPTSPDPTAPALSLSFTTAFDMVSAGETMTCAITEAGVAWCWGTGDLGHGDHGSLVLSPVRVAGSHRYVTISTGSIHTCAVARSGRALCWGTNLNGELGTGTSISQSLVPVAVAGGLVFQDVTVGAHHACALDLEGRAWCWGLNSAGQLGDGTIGTLRRRPVRVLGGHRFARISAGSLHTCAVGVGGRAFCWGEAARGALGTGVEELGSRTRPVEVAGELTFGRIAVGSGHACGILRTSALRCWGGNGSGQVGDATVEDRFGPTPIADGYLWDGASAGTFHSCGITTARQAFCWGSNSFGQLGDGTTGDFPFPTQVATSVRFRRISAGDSHSCAIGTDRRVYCWGAGFWGQLGDGMGTSSTVPVPILAAE